MTDYSLKTYCEQLSFVDLESSIIYHMKGFSIPKRIEVLKKQVGIIMENSLKIRPWEVFGCEIIKNLSGNKE